MFESGSTASDLLAAAKRLDAEAWRGLVERYSWLIVSWCQKEGLPADDAPDVLQAVLLQVARNLAHFEKDGRTAAFRRWLRAITRSQMAEFRRAAGNQPRGRGGTSAQQHILDVPDRDPETAFDPRPERLLERFWDLIERLESELIELIAGRLSRERHEVLDEHVRACAACQAILETLDEPHDVCISAVRELAHLAMSQARRPVQHVIDRLCSLPAAQADPHSSSQFDSPLLGERTLGDFRILRLVGRGGMGMVYEARQISLGRTVALKTLPFAGLLDPRRLQRFQNEARAAASLEHPHIVPVYAVGVDRGVYFYAMRFLDGPNLAEIIDQWRGPAAGGSIAPRITETTATPPGAIAGQVPPPGANGGGIEETPEPRQNGASGRDPGLRGRRDQDPGPHGRREPSQPGWAQGTACVADGSTASFARRVGHADGPAILDAEHLHRVVRLTIEAARALDFAHERGVVHRDIKPSNLMLDARGVLWITDFGLARIEADPTFSASGEVIGTLRYMSPEQALGKRGVVDHRSDIYSLGVTLYELLTLTPIFPDLPDPVVLAKIAAEDPTPLRRLNPSIPVDLETIVQKAMSKEAAERYATAEEFAADLEHFCDRKKIKAQRPRAADRLARWLRRHPGGLAVVATAVVALVVLAAGFATYSAQLRRTVRERDESNALLKVANIETAAALRESKASGERADRALQESREQIYAQDMEHAGRESEGEDLSQASNLLASHVPQSGETDLRGFEWYWLRGRLRGTGPTLHVSQKPVYDAEYSPDGLRLATGGADAVLHVFDTRTGHELLRVATGQIEVNAVAFAPDGKTIATTGDDGTIRLWDAQDGKPRLRIEGPRGLHAFSVLFTPDGRQLVSNANDPLIRIWNAQTGELEAELRGSEGKESVTQIALTRDGKTLASGSDDGAARIWDLTTRTCRRTLRVNEGSCLAVAFSPDARLLLAGYSDRTVRLWICADGTTALTGRLRDSLQDVCFLPTGEGVVAADSGGSIRVWNILPGEAFSAPPATRTAAFYSLWKGGSDRSVRRWQRHVGAIHHIAVARDGNTVASAGNDGTVSLTDLRSVVRDGPLAGFESPWLMSQFCFGPHDELLWGDRATQLEGYTPGGNGWVTNLVTGRTEKWEAWDSTGGIARTPNGADVLFGNDHGKMTIRHRRSQRPRETWDFKANGYLEQIDFAPDGRNLVVRFQFGPDGFRVYDYPTHQRLDRPPSGLVGNPTTFARSGWWLVTNGDRMGSVWELHSPASPAHTFAYPNVIRALAVSPDGKLFASGGDDRKIALRRLPTGAVQKELIGHDAFVTSLAFTPDGRTLLSGDLSGMIKVWSVSTGRFICDLTHDARRKSEHIEFSPSGRYLAYAAYHGPLIVLDLSKLKADEQGPAAWGTAMPHPSSAKTIFDRYGTPAGD